MWPKKKFWKFESESETIIYHYTVVIVTQHSTPHNQLSPLSLTQGAAYISICWYQKVFGQYWQIGYRQKVNIGHPYKMMCTQNCSCFTDEQVIHFSQHPPKLGDGSESGTGRVLHCSAKWSQRFNRRKDPHTIWSHGGVSHHWSGRW